MRQTLDEIAVNKRRTALLHFLDDATPEELAEIKAALAEIEARAEGEQATHHAGTEDHPPPLTPDLSPPGRFGRVGAVRAGRRLSPLSP